MSGFETLSQGPAEHRSPTPRVRLGTAATVSAALVVAAWLGSGWWHDRGSNAPTARPTALEFVLQMVDVHQQDPQSPGRTVAQVSGFLVNTGLQPVLVQTFSWDGKVAGGPFTIPPQDVGPVLTSTSPVTCTESASPSPLLVPSARVRVRTGAGVVLDQTPRVVNGAEWELTIISQCLTPTLVSPGSVISVSPDFSSSLAGRTVLISVTVQNPGGTAVVATPGLDADGFSSAATPARATVRAGETVPAVVEVCVRDCGHARTGEVRGVTFDATDEIVPPPDLVRTLDRLVARTCGAL